MASPEQSASQDAAAPPDTVIHRKAQVGRAEHQARAMSLAKALRLTLAKVADAMFDLPVGVIGLRRETHTRETLSTPLDTDGLRMIFDGPHGARAALILDAGLVAALIQQQTMGKVMPEGDDSARTLTATDAAVCAPYLEEVLDQASVLPEIEADRRLITGLQFGAWAEDARILGMALEVQDYDVIHIDLDIAGGVRQGHALLCLPQVRAEPKLPETQEGETETDVSPAAPLVTLSDTVMHLEAEVRVGLTQVKMPLKKLSQLEIGSVIDLGHAPFDKVVVQTIAGRSVAKGVLGQADGQRAVQVKPVVRKLGATGFSMEHLSDETAPVEGLPAPEHPSLDQGAPDLPDLPEASAEEMPEMPDLPDLSDLPDLPDLSDLPDLPELDTENG